MNVAVVGVGNMGAPMAACMARAGHGVMVFDSSPERALKVAAEVMAAAPQRNSRSCRARISS